MEIAQLEMFVAVAEERNIRRAAERLFHTQPAVSIALKKLEEQTGKVLLSRARGQTARLTSAGELLYEFALRMIAVRDEALSKFRGGEISCAGRLLIGMSGKRTLEQVVPLLSKFRAENPLVRIDFSLDRDAPVLSEVAEHKLDAAFFSTYPTGRETASDLVITQVRASVSAGDLWLAVRRTGRSHTLQMFQQMVAQESAAMAIHRTAKRPIRKAPSPTPPRKLFLNAGRHSNVRRHEGARS